MNDDVNSHATNANSVCLTTPGILTDIKPRDFWSWKREEVHLVYNNRHDRGTSVFTGQVPKSPLAARRPQVQIRDTEEVFHCLDRYQSRTLVVGWRVMEGQEMA